MKTTEIPISVYVESTPNPAAMKFVANKLLVNDGNSHEFTSHDTAENSPLAQNLFRFPFVQSVFIAANFVSINKADQIEWDDITLELREFITNYLNNAGAILNEEATTNAAQKEEISSKEEKIIDRVYTEDEQKIISILDEYVKPAVEGDGGAIEFDSFKDGIVSVVLKGACSGCPSSTMTLKSGIEELLKSMMPSVNEVVAING